MSNQAKYSGRKQAMDLQRRDLADQLAPGRTPITTLNEIGAPRLAVLFIRIWEFLSRLPVFKAMSGRFEGEADALVVKESRSQEVSSAHGERPLPNYGMEGYMPEHRKVSRQRSVGGDLPS